VGRPDLYPRASGRFLFLLVLGLRGANAIATRRCPVVSRPIEPQEYWLVRAAGLPQSPLRPASARIVTPFVTAGDLQTAFGVRDEVK
jgi:hypothetical protein